MVDGKELHVTDKAGNEVATPPVRIVVDGGARGKGVVLRRTPSVATDPSASEARLHGELPTDPPRRMHRPLYASWVPRKSIGAAGWDSTPAHEAHRLMVDSSPVVMEGTGVADGLMKRWRTAQDVARDFGDGKVRCMIAAAKSRKDFYDLEAEKNVFGSVFHVREPLSSARAMTTEEFYDCCLSWRDTGVMMKTPLAVAMPKGAAKQAGGPAGEQASDKHREVLNKPGVGDGDEGASSRGGDDGARAAVDIDQLSLDALMSMVSLESVPLGDEDDASDACVDPLGASTVDGDTSGRALPFDVPRDRTGLRMLARTTVCPQGFMDGVQWSFFGRMALTLGYDGCRVVEMWVLPDLGFAPLKYYSEDAFVVCTHGRLRVCLVPPQHALSGCYPFPTRHPYDRHPMVDFCAPDTASWPQSADVRGCTCVLRPGDALYVPRDWFFSAQVLSADAKGMPATLLRVAMIDDDRGAPTESDALELSRAIEDWAFESEGLKDAREFLIRTAAGGKDARWDVGTPQGYERTRLSQEVRDEALALLGDRDAARAYLASIVDHRLMPTDWLNKDFTEPLYLTDKPRWEEDTRTEWERRYPQLFRHKLESEGWPVAPTQSTVRLPGITRT